MQRPAQAQAAQSTTTAIMPTVRCAGTPSRPAARNPRRRPPGQRAASGAGRPACRRPQPPSRATMPPTSQANIVTCRPEMLIRCATPVMRKQSQSRARSPPVAHRQRRQHAGGCRVGTCGRRRRAVLAQRRWRGRPGRQQFGRGRAASAPCAGAYALLEQPQLEVEAVGLIAPCGWRSRTGSASAGRRAGRQRTASSAPSSTPR